MITIPLYDYSGENYKESLHPISAEVENKGGNLTFELSAEASDYWSGGIALGDRLLAPYPWQIGMGEWFRICKIAAENSTVTIKAAHLTEDILSAYCSVDTSGSFTLHEFVTDILQDPAFLTNSGDIEFDWFYHDEDDERYEQTHECNIKAMDGAGILQHIASVFGCNFIRHENKIVLTYGSASDYFRDLYGLIPFSGSFRKGRNVVGLASEDSNEDLITAILPTVKVTINEIETQNAGAPVVNTDFAALYGRAEALKHLKKVEYNPNVERNEGESDLDYARRVVAAAQGEAQTEVDSYNTDTQSISIEISARDGERLFGGEIGTCIDADMRQSFDLVIEGFSLDLMRGVYYDIELGRVGASLADLAGGRGAGGLSGGGISSATLTAIYSAIGDAKSTAQGAAGTAATALSTAQTAQSTADGKVSKSGDTMTGTLTAPTYKVGDQTSNVNAARLQNGILVYGHNARTDINVIVKTLSVNGHRVNDFQIASGTETFGGIIWHYIQYNSGFYELFANAQKVTMTWSGVFTQSKLNRGRATITLPTVFSEVYAAIQGTDDAKYLVGRSYVHDGDQLETTVWCIADETAGTPQMNFYVCGIIQI